ncbi:hypothetical protein PREVCOP_04483 [Segatella copri DSM 18205]|uniref:Uncharacterized protein n=1 Tax=Segatella copri DSM 18205 TaxID=537011 RepID=D1PBA5_9BACT|nr:hypothetical protein PREVCOP_04483 [Segatella copri DSM 18205]
MDGQKIGYRFLFDGTSSPHALKGQKLLAQGNTLGFSKISAMRPVRAKALKCGDDKAFALTGRRCCLHVYPGCCPGLGASALSGRVEHI